MSRNRKNRGLVCPDCGDREHLRCDMSHPHCYFRCEGSLRSYLHKWFLAEPVGPNKIEGWRSQHLSLCDAHAAYWTTVKGLQGRQESWELVKVRAVS